MPTEFEYKLDALRDSDVSAAFHEIVAAHFAAIAALEAERDALRVTEEAAMRVALQIMANLDDRKGVFDDVDDDTKQEIADEIAVTIFAAFAVKEKS